MKINSPEDIVSAYATMMLLQPICGDGYTMSLSISNLRVSLSVLDSDSDVVATTFYDEAFVFCRVLSSYPQRLIDKLNAALAAPEQNEN